MNVSVCVRLFAKLLPLIRINCDSATIICLSFGNNNEILMAKSIFKYQRHIVLSFF